MKKWNCCDDRVPVDKKYLTMRIVTYYEGRMYLLMDFWAKFGQTKSKTADPKNVLKINTSLYLIEKL